MEKESTCQLVAKNFAVKEDDIPNLVRTFKGCENHTDEEARDIYHSLGILAEILLNVNPNKMHVIDNQLVVSLKGEQLKSNNQKKAA